MKAIDPAWEEVLIHESATMGVNLSASQAAKMACHAKELLKWNRKVNLTALTDPLLMATRHYLDSLSAGPYIPDHTTLLDMGTGAGFPGIPLKIAKPSLEVFLVDASRKKVNFLRHIIRRLKLTRIEALQARVEDMAIDPLHFQRYPIIISRAFAALGKYIDNAIPLLQKKGQVIALKGPKADLELEQLEATPFFDIFNKSHQFSIATTTTSLPITGEQRAIVVLSAK